MAAGFVADVLEGFSRSFIASYGWPQATLRELLPDRMLTIHAELYVGDPDALPLPSPLRALSPEDPAKRQSTRRSDPPARGGVCS